MKFQVALIAAAAALVAAAPAAANEVRVEARGGMTFGESQSEEAIAGIAAGYDLSVGDQGAFFGVEASADKILIDNSGLVLGATARTGFRTGPAKFFMAGGYSHLTCDLCSDAIHIGAGAEVDVASNVYGKLEYRRFFFEGIDSNVVAAGVGMRF